MQHPQTLFAAAAILALPLCAAAGPADYVYTPAVEYGEREIDLKAGTWQRRDDQGRDSAASLGFGYGAAEWWFTEVYVKYVKNPGDRTRYDALEWENKFQLTEHNQFPVDVGLIAELEIPRERHEEGYEIKLGPLFQGDVGPVRWNANLLFERMVRGRSEERRVTEMGYQLQARYSMSPTLDVGAQAFGEMGEWNHWEPSSEQKHHVGPAIFGKVKLGGRQSIRYNLAWLLPASHEAPKNWVRLQAEFEF